jgi:signal transduction histidine kinase
MAQRIFLLHVSADLVLLVMVGILTLRFVHALDTAANLNRDLEQRVAERENELQIRHAQMDQLTREQATSEERQRIMQDLHDGLGSQMFTALLRVERGDLDPPQVAQALRDCIADMRLTFEVIAPESRDFLTSLVDFRFRWEELLHSAGLESQWDIDLSAPGAALPPAVVLQVLRVAQEALTNALKHSGARRVQVVVTAQAEALVLAVKDDGRGLAAAAPSRAAGRGLSNMRQRATRIGAVLDIASQPGHTCVTLRLPLAAAA